jgi:hypothetical protein
MLKVNGEGLIIDDNDVLNVQVPVAYSEGMDALNQVDRLGAHRRLTSLICFIEPFLQRRTLARLQLAVSPFDYLGREARGRKSWEVLEGGVLVPMISKAMHMSCVRSSHSEKQSSRDGATGRAAAVRPLTLVAERQ